MDFDDCPPPLPPPTVEAETAEDANEEPPMTTMDGTGGDAWILRSLELAREKAKEESAATANSANNGGGKGKKGKKGKGKGGNNSTSNNNSGSTPPPTPPVVPENNSFSPADVPPPLPPTNATTSVEEVSDEAANSSPNAQPALPVDSDTVVVDVPSSSSADAARAPPAEAASHVDAHADDMVPPPLAAAYDPQMDATTAHEATLFGAEQPAAAPVAFPCPDTEVTVTPAHEVPPVLSPEEAERQRLEALMGEVDADERTAEVTAARRASLPPTETTGLASGLSAAAFDAADEADAIHVDGGIVIDDAIVEAVNTTAEAEEALAAALGGGASEDASPAPVPEEIVDLPPRPEAPVPPTPPPTFLSSDAAVAAEEPEAPSVVTPVVAPIPTAVPNDSIALDDDDGLGLTPPPLPPQQPQADDIDLDALEAEEEVAATTAVPIAADESIIVTPSRPQQQQEEAPVARADSDIDLEVDVEAAGATAAAAADTNGIILSDDDDDKQQQQQQEEPATADADVDVDAAESAVAVPAEKPFGVETEDLDRIEAEEEAAYAAQTAARAEGYHAYYNQVYTGAAQTLAADETVEAVAEDEAEPIQQYNDFANTDDTAARRVEAEASDIEEDAKYERLPTGDRVVRSSEFDAFATRAVELIQSLQETKDAEVTELHGSIGELEAATADRLAAAIEASEAKAKADYMSHIGALQQHLDAKVSDVITRGDSFVEESVEAMKQHVAFEIQAAENRIEAAMSEQRKKNREKFATVAEKLEYMQSAIDVVQEALKRAMDLEQFPEPRPIPEGTKIRLQVRLEVARPAGAAGANAPVPILLVPISDKANVADLKHEAIRRARRQATIGDGVVYSKTAIVFENLTLFDDDDFADIGLDRGDLTVSLVFTGAEAAVQRHYENAAAVAAGTAAAPSPAPAAAPAAVFTSNGFLNQPPPPMPASATSPAGSAAASSPTLAPPPPPPAMANFPAAPPPVRLGASKDIINGYFLREELAKDINEHETLERRLMGELERMERDPLKNQESLCRIRLAKDIMNRVRSALLDKATYCYQEAHRAAARASLAAISAVMDNPSSTVDDFMRASTEAQRVVDGVGANDGEQGRIDALEEAAARNQAKKDRMKDDLEELGYELRNKLRVDYELMPMAERLMDQIDRCSILAASMSLEELDEVHSRVVNFIQSVKAKQCM